MQVSRRELGKPRVNGARSREPWARRAKKAESLENRGPREEGNEHAIIA